MNIKRKILIKLNRINNLEVEHKNLSLPFYHGQHNSFLSNISLVPVISSAYQLPPKNNMNSISINCHELNKYYYLNLPDNNIYSLDNLITILKQHPDIEYVQTVPIQPIEPPNITPDFTQYQQYLYEPEKTVNINKIIGLGVLGAWKQEAYGQGVQVADIEWDFNLSHHDLSTDNITSLLPFNEKTSQADHGTAVAGLIMGKKDGKGITGLAYKLDMFYAISELTCGRIDAIIASKRILHAGDIVLYEMQTICEHQAYVPADYEMHIWEATRALTDAGIIVIMAAGNGGVDLDLPAYESYRQRNDNNSIRVGAGSPYTLNRLPFSTHGSPIHVQAWGEDVATAGYGDLFRSDDNHTYTANFSGTSSASALVAGAAAVIQSWYKNHTNSVLTPIQMRDLLIRTGTFPQLNDKIGPLPNVNNAILYLKKRIKYH
ncbi:S8 family serine peptidase [Proteus vulgaris]|uniref:Serine protease n=3 Tax=Gammaproteobacteria TaxID=1236 RepID=A0A379F9U2_PROVU|nr:MULTISPECIES: S8 family peptidase [Proteus]RNT23950.1 serine protease [Proteus mirabilis]AYY82114.1 serine protease [Proteus vulgaris]KGA57349.1 subtilase family protein [Proteus vulgaris]MBG5970221.1 S8 family serine peptidase [Proteus vulgaris]MBG5985641.1 S8 family serine peptidase [Proteus vulgaris]